MADVSRDQDAQRHATNLDYTLRELQRKISEHEGELAKIQLMEDETLAPVTQVNVIRAALEDITNSEPFLPFSGSILPALVALRKTHETIQESKAYLAARGPDMERDNRQLDLDQASLKDQKLLGDALEARIRTLRQELNSQADMQPEDSAREKLEELRKKKKNYDKETSRLMKELNSFIDRSLAAMLAAEELGGPVVGDMMDVDSEDLAAGFNTQGKLKKAKDGTRQDKRQRRLDEIWGSGEARAAHGEEENEVTVAGTEMRQLTEELLNRLAEARGDNSSSYVELGRESAAARFLVRSKVAQFHPRDATRLRLVDFGRDLAD